MTDKIINKMSNATFETDNGETLKHLSGGQSLRKAHLDEKLFDNKRTNHFATDIAKEIVNEMFDGVFYKQKEFSSIKTTKTGNEKPAVGDNLSNNSCFQNKVIACVHNFDKSDEIHDNNKDENQSIRYTSGEPILLGYHKDNSSSNSLENAESIHCEICDNQSKYIISKDHCCPKAKQNKTSKMACDLKSGSDGIVTIQNVFESNYDRKNASLSGISQSNVSDEFFEIEDDDYSEEKECESLGTLEQKSDIFDLVKNPSRKSTSSTLRKCDESRDQLEKSEESLIQVINLEWVEPPPPGANKEPEDIGFVKPQFDDEKMDVIDLNEIQKGAGGKGDDAVKEIKQQNVITSERIEEPDVLQEGVGNFSKTDTGSSGETLEKKNRWNRLIKTFSCLFSRRNKRIRSSGSEHN